MTLNIIGTTQLTEVFRTINNLSYKSHHPTARFRRRRPSSTVLHPASLAFSPTPFSRLLAYSLLFQILDCVCDTIEDLPFNSILHVISQLLAGPNMASAYQALRHLGTRALGFSVSSSGTTTISDCEPSAELADASTRSSPSAMEVELPPETTTVSCSPRDS